MLQINQVETVAKVNRTRNVYTKSAGGWRRRLSKNSTRMALRPGVSKRENSGMAVNSTANVLFSKHLSSMETAIQLKSIDECQRH